MEVSNFIVFSLINLVEMVIQLNILIFPQCELGFLNIFSRWGWICKFFQPVKISELIISEGSVPTGQRYGTY